LWIREWLEEDAVCGGEEGGVGADAEGEREDGDERKGRGFAEGAQSEACVGGKVFEVLSLSFVAAFFACRCDGAKQAAGFEFRLLWGEAFFDQFGLLLFEVKGEFVGELVVEVVFLEEGLEAEEEFHLCGPHDEGDGGREAVPLIEFDGELFLTGFGEGVELGDAAGFGGFGFGVDPTLLLETVEGWVERALLDEEDVAGGLLDAFGNGPAVDRLEGDGFEDEEVEGSLEEIVWLAHTMIIYNFCR